jgi:hypothetical protein
MLIVVQSRDGFRPIDALPKEMTFNADDYISYILKVLGRCSLIHEIQLIEN